MSQPIGSLDVSSSRWIVAHSTELVRHIPHPACRWTWSETNLSQSTLCQLRNRNLIKRDGECWKTPKRTIDQIALYSDTDADQIGETVGSVQLDFYSQKR